MSEDKKFESPIDELRDQVTDLTNEGRWALGCYVPVINVFVAVVASVKMVSSKFVLFHARQGLIIFAFGFLSLFLSFISAKLTWMFQGILFLAHVAGIVIVLQKKMTKLPVIGQFVDRIPESYIFELLTGQKPQSNDEKIMHKQDSDQNK